MLSTYFVAIYFETKYFLNVILFKKQAASTLWISGIVTMKHSIFTLHVMINKVYDAPRVCNVSVEC